MNSATKLTVRAYRPGDLDAVIAIFVGAVREVASKDYTPAQIDAWATVDRAEWEPWRLTRPTWIAELGDASAGFADLESDGHLDMMFVHPDYQRIGVATALLESIEAAARQRSILRIFTEASITARPFFERRGFRVIAARDEIDGHVFTNYRMEKLLA
jgi:putative acetyltransferase